MEHDQLKKQLGRWKLGALLAGAFALGQLTTQFTGSADAQTKGVMKVQIDTSNCKSGLATGSSMYNVPDGSLLMQALRQGSGAYDTAWIYNKCR